MRSKLIIPLALLLSLAAIGCGSSSNNNAANPPAPGSTTTTTTTPALPNKTVKVVETEMRIVAIPRSAQSGQVAFSVDNQGKLAHEMVVLRTDKKADALGTGSTVPEKGRVGETGDIAPGASRTLKLNLKPGHYALICNIPGHYAAGMHADFQAS